MTENRYRAAAWISFTEAFMVVPLLLILFLFGATNSVGFVPLVILFSLAAYALTIVMMVKLLDLVHEKYESRSLDTPVAVTLVMGGVMLLTGLVMLVIGADGPIALLITALPVTAAAVAGLVLGVRILKLPGELGGLKIALGVTMICGWALALTFFLSPLAMLVQVLESILLGLVFLRADRSEIPEFV